MKPPKGKSAKRFPFEMKKVPRYETHSKSCEWDNLDSQEHGTREGWAWSPAVNKEYRNLPLWSGVDFDEELLAPEEVTPGVVAESYIENLDHRLEEERLARQNRSCPAKIVGIIGHIESEFNHAVYKINSTRRTLSSRRLSHILHIHRSKASKTPSPSSSSGPLRASSADQLRYPAGAWSASSSGNGASKRTSVKTV